MLGDNEDYCTRLTDEQIQQLHEYQLKQQKLTRADISEALAQAAPSKLSDFYDEREKALDRESTRIALNIVEELGKPDLNKETKGKMTAGVIQDFLPALKLIAELGSSNNKPHGKYDRGSWLKVQNPEVQYLDAFWRHQLDGLYNVDPTTGQIHLVAMTWNLLALLTFYLREQQNG